MILSLETSAKACTVSLSSQGRTMSYKEAEGEWKHSKVITLLIQACLEEVAVEMGDLTAVAVSKGPGSYTGLRVGASCAKGICYALDIPLISIPTLEIVAFPFSGDTQVATALVPMIDARRMEVYYNEYSMKLQTELATTNLVLDSESIEHFKRRQLLFCGDGAHKMKAFEDNEARWQINPSFPHAKDMADLAFDKYQQGLFEDLTYYVPFYLKPPNITKSTKTLF